MSCNRPPVLAEKILARILPCGSPDSVLGDMHEDFERIITERGILTANAMYWTETIRALPSLLLYSLETSNIRRQTVIGTFIYRERKWTTPLSVLLLLPAFLLVIPGLLFEIFGKPIEGSMNGIPGFAVLRAWTDDPWLILGGLALALAINLNAIVRVQFFSSKDDFQTTLTWKRSASNMILIVLALILAGVLFSYAIGENLLPLL